MASPEEKKSFWHSLPGFMTALASLLTAIAAVAGLISGTCKNEKVSALPPAVSPFSVPAPGNLQDISRCGEITGKWSWFTGGETTIEPNGGLSWKHLATDPSAMVRGQWTCTDSKPPTFMLSWQNGLTDVVTLSPDGKSLGGTNQAGVRVSASRQS